MCLHVLPDLIRLIHISETLNFFAKNLLVNPAEKPKRISFTSSFFSLLFPTFSPFACLPLETLSLQLSA